MPFRAAFFTGTHSGLPGLYNRAVRKWERGDYSHVELQFSDGLSASASFMDGGVRFKQIGYTSGDWDFVDLPPAWEAPARAYFEAHDGEAYNLIGNVHFVIGFVPPSPRKKCCSEAVAGALGLQEAWRFMPNALASTVRRLVEVHYNIGADGRELAQLLLDGTFKNA